MELPELLVKETGEGVLPVETISEEFLAGSSVVNHVSSLMTFTNSHLLSDLII
jgi:hypothetical protein